MSHAAPLNAPAIDYSEQAPICFDPSNTAIPSIEEDFADLFRIPGANTAVDHGTIDQIARSSY
jgi:hypothetical protein